MVHLVDLVMLLMTVMRSSAMEKRSCKNVSISTLKSVTTQDV
jgi:hypothetical protein